MKHARDDYKRIQDPALHDPSLLSEGSTAIGEDEPVFLLRAKDSHAAETVMHYAKMLDMNPDVDKAMVEMCMKQSLEMSRWPNRKTPDVP